VQVSDVARLYASKLAWAGIVEHGTAGALWPFEELLAESKRLAEQGADALVLRLKDLHHERLSPNRVLLTVTFEESHVGDDPASTHERWDQFALVCTRPNYGGRRWWFECPGCTSRRACIYLIPCLYSYCRECLGLTYESQL